jgi:type IV pilus assembly protein PilY1
MVTFGTGRYLTPSDPLDLSVQTFYGVRDNGAAIITTDRSELQQQTISLQQQHTTGRWVRSVTGATPDWTIEKGWYLDLVDRLPAGTFVAAGERVVSTPIIKFDRVIFVTVVPSTDPCLPGGTSWLMELNLVTGGTFAESILDVNDDGNFNDFDNVGGQVVSGVRMDGLGISKTPVWLDCPSGDCAFKIMTGTSGNFGSERNRTPNPPPPVPGQVTRRSWIQIR